MSGSNWDYRRQLVESLRTDAARLDRSCRCRLGVSAFMFRTVKYVFYIITLAMTVWLIEYGYVDPLLALGFAALLITGPEGLEAYLIRQDVLAEPEPPEQKEE